MIAAGETRWQVHSLRDSDATPWLEERQGIEARPSPRPSPIRWEREAIGRVRASLGGPVCLHGAGFLRLDANPSGLETIALGTITQGRRAPFPLASQPRADGCNPFGIRLCASIPKTESSRSERSLNTEGRNLSANGARKCAESVPVQYGSLGPRTSDFFRISDLGFRTSDCRPLQRRYRLPPRLKWRSAKFKYWSQS